MTKTYSRASRFNYESLANAIVKQAYDDYVYALSPSPIGREGKCQQNNKAVMREDVESFFSSEWYMNLTRLDSDILIKAAIMEKASMRVNRWLDVITAGQMKSWRKSKTIDFKWGRNCKSRICDSRHEEWKMRKAWHKERLKKKRNVSA